MQFILANIFGHKERFHGLHPTANQLWALTEHWDQG